MKREPTTGALEGIQSIVPDAKQLAAEHRDLQARWKHDAHAIERLRTELAGARVEMARERERREQAEAEALRGAVRGETMERLLAQLRPDRAGTTPDASSPDTPAQGQQHPREPEGASS